VDKVQALANPVSLFQQEIVNLLLRRKTMFVGVVDKNMKAEE